MKTEFFQKPFWLVGFRPFFFFAFWFGALLPLLWVLVLRNGAIFPLAGLLPVQWHAHEMLFGFGWAVLGGFLLTASKNWLKIRGLHGAGLATVVLIWLFERFFFLFGPSTAQWPQLLRFSIMNISVLVVGGYVVFSLLKYRKNDTFSDNYFFILALPIFLFSKVLLLNPETYAHGAAMGVGVFRVAFAVMFERTMTQFMKNSMGIEVFRSPYLDLPIKSLVLLSVFQAFWPPIIAAAILAGAATLLLLRFFLWQPHIGFRKFEIAVMYIGYLGLTTHLFFEAAKISGFYQGIGAISAHVFTFLCMGVVIPAMIIRISQGHTGRKLIFTLSDKVAIYSVLAAAFFRLVATQVWASSYLLWNSMAAVGWSICFILIGLRLSPFLFQPRVDGKVH